MYRFLWFLFQLINLIWWLKTRIIFASSWHSKTVFLFTVFFQIAIFIYITTSSSSSSSCCTTSMDLPDPLLPPLSIVLHSQLVFKATSCIGRELLYVGFSWSSCLCLSMWKGPQEYVTYEFVPTSLTVSCMSGSSNMDGFHDGSEVAVQLLLCGVPLPGLV